MKKNLSLTLAALFCALSPMAVQQSPPLPQQEEVAAPFKLGREAIAAVRQAYEEGEFRSFLHEMEQDYQKVRKKGGLENLAAFRKGSIDSHLREIEEQLQKEKNRDLLQLVSEKDSLFAEKVRTAATSLPANEEETLLRLSSFSRMAPGSGKNGDENQLIELDLAYEYKAIHLDLPVLDGEPLSNRREKQYALKMEKMEKMVEASKTFKDSSLKDAVAMAAGSLDARLARNWDLSDLNALARGTFTPVSPLEKKVVSILNAYRDKIAELSGNS